MADLNDSLFNSASEQYVESSHKFTEPVRMFKSNDPYYWEVDNIPLKQLEENILFLRDQIANNLSVSGIGRSDLAELRPFVNGTDRTVYVNPGRYSARINDAYEKGLNNFEYLLRNDVQTFVGADQTRSGYATLGTREKRKFTLSVEQMKKLAGITVLDAINDNGLYTFLQHHNSEPEGDPNSLEYRSGIETSVNPGGQGIYGLPKIKGAAWRPEGLNTGTLFFNDLQQEAVEFTRLWGGVARTAIVDVQEVLSVEVPAFDDTEFAFANNTEFSPAVRIDLVFIYSHPVDARTTSIVKPSSTGTPQKITAPQLGILKGAGVIALNLGTGAYSNYTTSDSGFFDSSTYINGSSTATNHFISENTYADDDGSFQMNSTMGDQLQTEIGLNGEFANIPSPDDLMNLTPLLEETLESNNLALVGQSILPVAYVISRRGQPVIVTNDLFDIRPFMRTTELSYNERAGVAAANPPLSLANPAVGKQELENGLFKVRDFVQEQLNSAPLESKPLARGMVYGGTRYGVEGAILMLEKAYGEYKNDVDWTSDSEVLDFLRTKKHVLSTATQIPYHAGWDINTDYFGSLDQPGLYRNDRLHSSQMWGYESGPNAPISINEELTDIQMVNTNTGESEPITALTDAPQGRYRHRSVFYHGSSGGWRVIAQNGSVFVKKTIYLNGLTDGYEDYDVNVSLISCSLTNGIGAEENGGAPEWMLGVNYGGVTVEKEHDRFTIFVHTGPVAPRQGYQVFCKPLATDEDFVYNIRNRPSYNYCFVSSRIITDFIGSSSQYAKPVVEGGSHRHNNVRDIGPSFGGMWVNYPTVSFTVTGYRQDAGYINSQSTGTVNGTSTMTLGS